MQHLWSLIERAARLHPETVGFVEGERRETYAAHAVRARALASFVRSAGAGEGERVSALLWNGIDYACVYFAAAGAGAILNPLNTRLSAQEFAAIARDCESRLLVTDSSFAPQVTAALAAGAPWRLIVWTDHLVETSASGITLHDALRQGEQQTFVCSTRGGDDTAHLYYTSGTTGVPKGVMLTLSLIHI